MHAHGYVSACGGQHCLPPSMASHLYFETVSLLSLNAKLIHLARLVVSESQGSQSLCSLPARNIEREQA